MGGGEAIRSGGRIAWLGEAGLNHTKPRAEDRQPGPDHLPEAKTTAEAFSHIELLYQSGRMEDLGQLLRKSQVFRAAWLILQQSSSDLSEAAGGGEGSAYQGKYGGPAYLPVPASGPPQPAPEPQQGTPGAKVGQAETRAEAASEGTRDFFAPQSQGAHPLSLLLQAYLNQDGYWARERQRGQLVSLRA